jgi:hypothetical protein
MAEQETTKKAKRLTWQYDEKTRVYEVTIHLNNAGKAKLNLDEVFPGFASYNEGQVQLVLCGVREKTSQVMNQAVSSHIKKNEEDIKLGVKEKLPKGEELLDSVLNAFGCFESGKWPTDIKGTAEPKVKLSDVKATMLEKMLEQGIPEDVARSIVAKL